MSNELEVFSRFIWIELFSFYLAVLLCLVVPIIITSPPNEKEERMGHIG